MFSFLRRMDPSRRRLLLTCFYAFFCSGMVSLMLGSAMPDLKRSWGLSDSFSGVLLSAHSIGNMVAGFGCYRYSGPSFRCFCAYGCWPWFRYEFQ